MAEEKRGKGHTIIEYGLEQSSKGHIIAIKGFPNNKLNHQGKHQIHQIHLPLSPRPARIPAPKTSMPFCSRQEASYGVPNCPGYSVPTSGTGLILSDPRR